MEQEHILEQKKIGGNILAFFKDFRKTFRFLLIGFFAWLFIRTFFFQVMFIPSSSMRNTLHEGDYIFVNKMVYGPRLPMTLLSFPFAGSSAYLDWIELGYHRIPGYSTIHTNDIIVFNNPNEDQFPIDLRQPYIKRCIGLPGDLINISGGIISINGKILSEPEGVQHLYEMEINSSVDGDSLLKAFGISEYMDGNDPFHFKLFMTIQTASAINATGKIYSLNLLINQKGRYNSRIFPHDPKYKFNTEYFENVLIPKKGTTIIFNDSNSCLYRRVIETYEGNSFSLQHDSVFINKKYSKDYTFKQDYYFVLGDNRNDSEDSRYWGFLPEDHIIGRASMLLFSSEKSRHAHILN